MAERFLWTKWDYHSDPFHGSRKEPIVQVGFFGPQVCGWWLPLALFRLSISSRKCLQNRPAMYIFIHVPIAHARTAQNSSAAPDPYSDS